MQVNVPSCVRRQVVLRVSRLPSGTKDSFERVVDNMLPQVGSDTKNAPKIILCVRDVLSQGVSANGQQ